MYGIRIDVVKNNNYYLEQLAIMSYEGKYIGM